MSKSLTNKALRELVKARQPHLVVSKMNKTALLWWLNTKRDHPVVPPQLSKTTRDRIIAENKKKTQTKTAPPIPPPPLILCVLPPQLPPLPDGLMTPPLTLDYVEDVEEIEVIPTVSSEFTMSVEQQLRREPVVKLPIKQDEEAIRTAIATGDKKQIAYVCRRIWTKLCKAHDLQHKWSFWNLHDAEKKDKDFKGYGSYDKLLNPLRSVTKEAMEVCATTYKDGRKRYTLFWGSPEYHYQDFFQKAYNYWVSEGKPSYSNKWYSQWMEDGGFRV